MLDKKYIIAYCLNITSSGDVIKTKLLVLPIKKNNDYVQIEIICKSNSFEDAKNRAFCEARKIFSTLDYYVDIIPNERLCIEPVY